MGVTSLLQQKGDGASDNNASDAPAPLFYNILQYRTSEQ